MKKRVAIATSTAVLLLSSAALAAPKHPSIAEGSGLRWAGWSPLAYAHDVAFTNVAGRDLAVAISFQHDNSGTDLKVVDVTSPTQITTLATLHCADHLVQVTPTSKPELIAVMVSGTCLGAQGFGLALLDLARPEHPTIAEATTLDPPRNLPSPRNPWPPGHPSVIGHPSAPLIYTTRQVDGQGEFIAWSIGSRNTLKRASVLMLPGEPRDLDVRGDGSLAAIAMGQTFATVDLSDPVSPTLHSLTHCPGCSVVSEVAFAGTLGLVVSDESANSIGCPSGSLNFYTLEFGQPQPYSIYNPSRYEEDPAEAPFPLQCTSDDLDITPDGDQALLTWHRNSVRLLDISRAFGAGASDTGLGRVLELGWFRISGGRTSAARFLDNRTVLAVDENWGLNALRIQSCAYRSNC